MIPAIPRNPCADNVRYHDNRAGSAAASLEPRRRRRVRARRASERTSARPTPRGGGGVRVPICIDTYPECVLILEVVDVGSTFLHMFATCRQSAFCKDI